MYNKKIAHDQKITVVLTVCIFLNKSGRRATDYIKNKKKIKLSNTTY